MATSIDITVGGQWITHLYQWGDLQMSTIYPGGSDQLSWTPAPTATVRHRGGEPVVAYYGGVAVWAGHLLEPDPSADQLTAIGAFHEGDEVPALDGSGNASATPDEAIDDAISNGWLNWTRPASIRSTAMTALDISQGPVDISPMLDTFATNNTLRWLVDPYRNVRVVSDPTAPTYQTLPVQGGLGFALDGYASVLVGRYLETATHSYKTVTATDAAAAANHGTVPATVDLVTGRGDMTSTVATSILNSLLALGRSTPRWTRSFTVSYSELLSMGGVAVALETVAAGSILRVNGGYGLPQRGNGAMYVDMLIGNTQLADGSLTLTPLIKAVTTYQDLVTELMTNRKAS